MNSNKRNIIILSLILLALIGIALYLAFRSTGGGKNTPSGIFGGSTGGGLSDLGSTDQAKDTSRNALAPGVLPIVENERDKIIQISREPVVGPTIDASGEKLLYFKRGEGKIYESTFTGEGGETQISHRTILNIVDAKWSHLKQYAIVQTLSGATPESFWIHLTGSSTFETGFLPQTITNYSFSPVEEKVASFIKVGQNNSLMISNPNGTGSKEILSTIIPDYEIAWISKNTLALKTRGSAFSPALFQLIPASGGLPSVISSGIHGFDSLWDTGGARYLATQTDTRGRNLLVTLNFLDGKTPQNKLPLRTLTEKCVFSQREKKSLYCGIPEYIGDDPLPDSWWQGKFISSDRLYKIDIETGEMKALAESRGFDVIQPFLSSDEKFLFFIDKHDSTLWSVHLE